MSKAHPTVWIQFCLNPKMEHCKALWILLLVGIFFTASSCGDLVKEDDSTSGCTAALNAKDFNTALNKCTERKNIAAAYLGKAGYDIIGLINASEANDPAPPPQKVINVLGNENATFAFALNTLRLGPDKIPNVTARMQAIRASKATLENVVKLYDGVSVTGEELILKTLGILFATSLELVMLLDVGMGTELDLGANFVQKFTGVNGKFLITSNPNIPANQVAHSKIDGTPVNNYLKKWDGRIWDVEQNLAFLPDTISVGGRDQKIYGNLGAICQSFDHSQGIAALIGKMEQVAQDFQRNFSGSTSDISSEVNALNDIVQNLNIQAACALKNLFP